MQRNQTGSLNQRYYTMFCEYALEQRNESSTNKN